MSHFPQSLLPATRSLSRKAAISMRSSIIGIITLSPLPSRVLFAHRITLRSGIYSRPAINSSNTHSRQLALTPQQYNIRDKTSAHFTAKSQLSSSMLTIAYKQSLWRRLYSATTAPLLQLRQRPPTPPAYLRPNHLLRRCGVLRILAERRNK